MIQIQALAAILSMPFIPIVLGWPTLGGCKDAKQGSIEAYNNHCHLDNVLDSAVSVDSHVEDQHGQLEHSNEEEVENRQGEEEFPEPLNRVRGERPDVSTKTVGTDAVDIVNRIRNAQADDEDSEVVVILEVVPVPKPHAQAQGDEEAGDGAEGLGEDGKLGKLVADGELARRRGGVFDVCSCQQSRIVSWHISEKEERGLQEEISDVQRASLTVQPVELSLLMPPKNAALWQMNSSSSTSQPAF